MPFGLKNAPAVFQKFLNDLFIDKQTQGVFVYLDDILSASKNLSEHIMEVREVLEILQKNNLYFKRERCLFCVSSL
jgi:Reverse transcriptase (RNA-dependent DNA polymerase)